MISNSSPLIFLSKIGKLNFLRELFKEIKITKDVRDEVLIEGKPDSYAIKRAIDENWIKIEDPKKEVFFGLGKGEESVISLALDKKDSLILDDALAIKVAKSFNIDIFRTTSIIFLALKNNLITKEEALKLVNKLIEEGYYISPKYYLVLVEELNIN